VGWSLAPVSQVNLSQIFSEDPDFQSARLGAAARRYINRAGITGLYVLDSTTGSPARQAKLVFGDLITSVEGTPVKSVSDMCDIVQSHGPGDKLAVRGRYLNSTSNPAKVLVVSWRTQVTLR
jgi:S1-C subfamily serine protease